MHARSLPPTLALTGVEPGGAGAAPRPPDSGDEPTDAELIDEYPNARRLGPYWDTPTFVRAILFEADVTRFLRSLVDRGVVSLDALPALVDRVRGRASYKPLPEEYRYAVYEFRQYLVRAAERFGRATVERHKDDILREIKEKSRRGRALWDDPPYWTRERRTIPQPLTSGREDEATARTDERTRHDEVRVAPAARLDDPADEAALRGGESPPAGGRILPTG